jgi:apolipoprotein N-acyltransferase
VKELPRLGLAGLSGLLLFFSFPKFGHWSVAWLALVPLLLALHGSSGRRAFRLGYVTGVVANVGILYWTALTVLQYGDLNVLVALTVMLLLSLAVALYPALFAWLLGRWLRRFGPRALLLAPVAWVASEIVRAHTLWGFSWCLLGYSQSRNLPMIQLASVGAVYGISFLLAGSSGVVAYAWQEQRPWQRWTALGGLAAVLAAVAAYGVVALRRPPQEVGRVRVGLVQANIRQDEKWDPQKAWENIDHHLNLTREAAARGARLVVWPESALPFLFDRNPPIARELQGLASQKGLYLLFGNDDREDREDGAYTIFVGAKMLPPDGGVSFRYHKIRLVPFGEFVPMKWLLGGRKLVEQVADFTPGTEYALGRVDGHALSVTICYEAIFPDHVREFTARGAELLVNITNDGWYGTSSATYQHFEMAAFRAVENGKYLVRAANTGITGVVDPRGRVVERTAVFDRGVLVRDVPFVGGTTFYARHGDVFAWSCLAVAVLLVLLGRGAPDASVPVERP